MNFKLNYLSSELNFIIYKNQPIFTYFDKNKEDLKNLNTLNIEKILKDVESLLSDK